VGNGPVKVAVVQRPPVLLGREACLQVVVDAITEVAAAGAALAVFPEAFIPGYPAWIWNLRPGGDYELSSQLHARLLSNSIDLSTAELRPVQEAAARHSVVVVCGIHEREGSFSRATLYNTLVTIGSDGTLLNRHRKLVPTNPERMVWGQGDASGLRVIDTAFGRLGGLICWENYMPLARYALYAEGVQIYIASTWDSGAAWLATMRHIACEGRCWVIGAGCALHTRDVPRSFPLLDTVFPEPDQWLNPGDSIIVAPTGDIVAGPLHQAHDILYGDIDADESASLHRTLDVAGHYARPDLFTLTVDRSAQDPINFHTATQLRN
jgi:nitrilase